ncbi:MAG: GNAT family N-acetyltransferase [Clostridium sp.]|nr:GNAT family N-acetyltransferase [Clostridium sp.]
MENLDFVNIDNNILDQCVDLFIDTFTKEPWYDVYESRNQVVEFFENFLKNNYFLGYAAIQNGKVVAISVGMKKPWIEGIEYYIDEFCVSYEKQGKGIGSAFIKYIEKDIQNKGLNGILLNTEKGYKSYDFYVKNGFKQIDDLVVLGR